MRKVILTNWGWVVLCLFLLTSCGSKKRAASKLKKEDTATTAVAPKENEGYLINNLDFRSFSGRAKTAVQFGDNKQDVTLNIRIDKDKAIWISVMATVFNYEAARVLITPDSVKILNKLQSQYIVKPFSYVHQYTGTGLNFSTLQDLLIANVSRQLLYTDQLTAASATDEVQLVGIKDNLSFQYSLTTKYRPKVYRLSTLGTGESLEAFYNGFADFAGYDFPQQQTINLAAKDMKINAVLEYKKVEFNQAVEMPFTVPASYKIIN